MKVILKHTLYAPNKEIVVFKKIDLPDALINVKGLRLLLNATDTERIQYEGPNPIIEYPISDICDLSYNVDAKELTMSEFEYVGDRDIDNYAAEYRDAGFTIVEK